MTDSPLGRGLTAQEQAVLLEMLERLLAQGQPGGC
jgi:hypothetical protein